MNVEKKDMERMLKLVENNNNGVSVAKSIKDKNKAVRRYVAGCYIINHQMSDTDFEFKDFGFFAPFALKAIELGANLDDFKNCLCTVPNSNRSIIISQIMELTCRLSDERLAYVQDATLDEIDECFNEYYYEECNKKHLNPFQYNKKTFQILLKILDETGLREMLRWIGVETGLYRDEE